MANNNQDFRTSLDPAGRRNQPVSSSGNAGSTRAARVDDAAATPAVVNVASSDRTVRSGVVDVFANHGAPSSAFVFEPGDGHGVVQQLVAGGAGHGTLSFAGADFGGSIAEALRHTRDAGDGAVIDDPATGDTVRLAGVTEAQLAHNPGDFAFHP